MGNTEVFWESSGRRREDGNSKPVWMHWKFSQVFKVLVHDRSRELKRWTGGKKD